MLEVSLPFYVSILPSILASAVGVCVSWQGKLLVVVENKDFANLSSPLANGYPGVKEKTCTCANGVQQAPENWRLTHRLATTTDSSNLQDRTNDSEYDCFQVESG